MKNAVLVIDYIRGIAEGKGSCAQYLGEHPEVIDNTNNVIKAAREHGDIVVHVRLAFDKDHRGLPEHAPAAAIMKANQRFLKDSAEVEFLDEIDRADSDMIVDKTYGSVFHGNDLIDQFKKQGVEHVIFTGVATNNAVLYGANDAVRAGFAVTVVTDACGASTQAAHEAALGLIKAHSAQCLPAIEVVSQLSEVVGHDLSAKFLPS